jgi:hypothetical protein
VQYVGAKMRSSIMEHIKPGDGVFLTSCVQHEMAWTSNDGKRGPYGPTIQNCTHEQAVASWAAGIVGDGEAWNTSACQLVAVDARDALTPLKAEPCNRGVFK